MHCAEQGCTGFEATGTQGRVGEGVFCDVQSPCVELSQDA